MIFAIPLVAAAAVVLLSGCNRKKSEPEQAGSSQVPPNRPSDPEDFVPFAPLGKDTYWNDLDLNGRPSDPETFTVPAGGNRFSEAKKFIERHRSYFSPCFRLQPTFSDKPLELSHPEKSRVALQLTRDIADLKKMKDRPAIYGPLLQDLEAIAEELPFVSFRYPEPDEVPEGFLGAYNPLINEMVVERGAPVSLILHEMDHQLTARRRVSPWTIAHRVLCNPGDLRPVAKTPGLPDPTPERTEFKFSLDFTGYGIQHFVYKDVDAWMPAYKTLELSAEPCLTVEAKDAALANEVRGYLTMARYLLYRVGFTGSDLKALREGGGTEKSAADGKLTRGLEVHLQGSNLNPRWAKQLVLHYLGRGGDSGQDNLQIFVERYYTAMEAPGFVKSPDCHPG